MPESAIVIIAQDSRVRLNQIRILGKEHIMNIPGRISSIGTLLLFAAAMPLAASAPPQANKPKTVSVMTRNLYVGADLTPAIVAAASGDPLQIIAAVSEIWGRVKFTNFPARAEGIAREVADAQPDLIGLQEAEIWRSQTPADFVMGNASHVEYDFVQSVLGG
jgi:hypothetical protein